MEGKIVKFRGRLRGSGTNETGGEVHGSAEVPGMSRVNPEVVAQILTIRGNLILSDPLEATERSVATADLASVVRWLRFVQSWKVEKYPSFYVRVLNRLEELRPDLFEKLRTEAEVSAVRKLTREQVEKNDKR